MKPNVIYVVTWKGLDQAVHESVEFAWFITAKEFADGLPAWATSIDIVERKVTG